MQVLGNCNYAVELGKKLNFVLVGIAGALFLASGGLDSFSCKTATVFLTNQTKLTFERKKLDKGKLKL